LKIEKYSIKTRVILLYAVFGTGAVVCGFAAYGFAHWMGWA
jgi:hypothetical protein